jgi:hypothetical protein
MVEKEVSLLLRLKDGVTKVLKDITDKADVNFKALKESSLIFAGAFAGVIAGIWGASKAFEEAQAVAAQTEKVLISTGYAAGMTTKSINELAIALQNKTGVDDDVIQSGENMLLTFTKIGKDSFPAATKAALDMTAAFNQGKVTQENLQGTMIQLGKALNDPTVGLTALRRVGVAFSDQQKEQIEILQKSGDLFGAQQMILRELQKEFGGSSEKLTTLQGAFLMARTQAGNFMELLGEQLAPTMTRLAEIISTAAIKTGDFIKAHKDLILPVTAAAVAFTGIIAAMAGIIAVAPAIAAAWIVITGPIGITVAAIAGLTAATVYFSTSQTKLAENVRAVWTGLQGIYSGNIDKIKTAWADLSESSKTHNEKIAEATKKRAEEEAQAVQAAADAAKVAAEQEVADKMDAMEKKKEMDLIAAEEKVAAKEEEDAAELEAKVAFSEEVLAQDQEFLDSKAEMEAIAEASRIQFEEKKKKYNQMTAAERLQLLIDTLGKEKILKTSAEIDELIAKGMHEEAKAKMDALYREAFLKDNADDIEKLEKKMKQHWTFVILGAELNAEERANIDKTMGQLYSDVLTLMGEKSIEAFRFMQAIAIGETIIKTYEAAQTAFAAMFEIPIVGEFLAYVAAATATAAGMVRVEAIRSQQPPAMEAGGYVKQGGLAQLHAAEVVLNKDQAETYQGNQPMNIYLQINGETIQKWIIAADEEGTRMERMGIR